MAKAANQVGSRALGGHRRTTTAAGLAYNANGRVRNAATGYRADFFPQIHGKGAVDPYTLYPRPKNYNRKVGKPKQFFSYLKDKYD